MKSSFRQSMAWLHTWGCLVVGWLLFFVFVLGTATVFRFEITRWMQPERALSTPVRDLPREPMVSHALDHLARHAPDAKEWDIVLPHARHRQRQENRAYLGLGAKRPSGGALKVDLDPQTGEVIPPIDKRDTDGALTFLELHSELHYLSADVGKRLVAACAMLGLLGVVTGIVVHKKIFKEFFTFRRGRGQRSWLDAHNVASVASLPFFIMIVYSGLVYFDTESLPVPSAVFYGTSQSAIKRYYDELTGRGGRFLTVERPQASIVAMIDEAERALGKGEVGQISITHPADGDLQVQLRRPYGSELPRYESPETVFRFDGTTGERIAVDEYGPGIRFRWLLLTLHDAWFATAGLLWLYVVCGLLGCVAIATGMVLWVLKRRERRTPNDAAASFGMDLVARLNIGVIGGLPIGVAAYFWANRLLPASMADRAEWEIDTLFAVWCWAIVYGLARPERRAWIEVLSLAAFAFGFIPILNALTTQRHLGVTLAAGDWGLAGFDVAMLALGAMFGTIALALWRRWHRTPRAMAAIPAGA